MMHWILTLAPFLAVLGSTPSTYAQMKPIRIRNKAHVVNADSTLPLEDEDDYLVTDIAVNSYDYDYTNAGSIGSYDYTEDGVSSYDYGNEDEDEAA